MGFIVGLCVIGLLYCLCEINKLKNQQPSEERERKEKERIEQQATKRLIERISILKEKQIEISLKEPLIWMDFMMHIKGQLVDMDHDWLLISCVKNKKQHSYVIRLEQIVDVKEIIA